MKQRDAEERNDRNEIAPSDPEAAFPAMNARLNAKNDAITTAEARQVRRSSRSQARMPNIAISNSGAKKKKPRYGDSVIA
jgi:hypothetical protein